MITMDIVKHWHSVITDLYVSSYLLMKCLRIVYQDR